MGLFSNFFKKKNDESKIINIVSPISGKIIKIEKVPDKVFSKKIVGDGVAIEPTGHEILSPINGTIETIFKTLHAFSILSCDGIELLVHFGIDTINLKGKGFIQIAKESQTVKMGDKIILLDLPFLKKHSKSIITPIVISNVEKIKSIKKIFCSNAIAGQTSIMHIKL
ncbi:PTS glucose transporter subunit IIA [Buchnera aphidicola (Formosaphis micheliae)]|uniref:PTS glucose transporter subunit IIA n=1 Tax=Buchnera aphidicola TaxID=9 RepID=UPI0031B86109